MSDQQRSGSPRPRFMIFVVGDYDMPVLASDVGFPWPGSYQQCTSLEVATPPMMALPKFMSQPIVHEPYPTNYDHSTKKVLRYINGYNHVSKIASLTRLKLNMVKVIIHRLMRGKVVFLIPDLELENIYTATLKLNTFSEEKDLQKTCVHFITKESDASDKPTIAEVIDILSIFKRGNICLRDVSDMHSGYLGPTFDFHRLIYFAEIHGFIECVENTTSD